MIFLDIALTFFCTLRARSTAATAFLALAATPALVTFLTTFDLAAPALVVLVVFLATGFFTFKADLAFGLTAAVLPAAGFFTAGFFVAAADVGFFAAGLAGFVLFCY